MTIMAKRKSKPKTKYPHLLELLRHAGYTGATLHYSGGGDEGQCDDIIVRRATESAMYVDGTPAPGGSSLPPKETVVVPANDFDKMIFQETGVEVGEPVNLWDALEEAMDENTDFNGAGSAGQIEFDVAKRTVVHHATHEEWVAQRPKRL